MKILADFIFNLIIKDLFEGGAKPVKPWEETPFGSLLTTIPRSKVFVGKPFGFDLVGFVEKIPNAFYKRIDRWNFGWHSSSAANDIASSRDGSLGFRW